MYTVTTIYKDGFTGIVCSLTWPAAVYFRRMMLGRGARSVTIEPETYAH